MARAGLGNEWKCLFANDIDTGKVAAYKANWGGDDITAGDIGSLSLSELPSAADLLWASFPCQDLSLAGSKKGLKGARSGTFWLFWKIVEDLIADSRKPKAIVLENVCGAITSHGGKDFAVIAEAITKAGFRLGALVIDAVHFVPQSRPRLFLVAVADEIELPTRLIREIPNATWHPTALRRTYSTLPDFTKQKWVWWHLPEPPARIATLTGILEEEPTGTSWHTTAETKRLLDMMTPVNRAKVREASKLKRRVVGTLYKRTRQGVQRAEVRFDEIAGCLRTPVGGSSRQTLIFVEGRKIRSRLLSPREAARLMGVGDSFILPSKYNEAYHLFGDGLVVPVVRYLSEHILEPLIDAEVLCEATA